MVNLYKKKAGVALVSVLLILAVMVTLIASMVEDQFISARQTSFQLIDELAYVENLQVETWAFEALIKQSAELYESDFLSETWSTEPFLLDADIKKKGVINDLQGKFNLNNLQGVNQQLWLPVFKRLLQVLDIDDTGDLTFFSDNVVKKVKSQKFSAIEELLLVEGINDIAFQKLLPHITVLKEANTKVNLNTASLELVQSILPNGLTSGFADQLVLLRLESPFETIKELFESGLLAGVGDTLNNVVDIKSQYFELESVIKINDAEKIYKMGIERQVSSKEGVTFTILYRKRVI